LQNYIVKCVDGVVRDIDRSTSKRANVEIVLASYEAKVNRTAGTGKLGTPLHVLGSEILKAAYGIDYPPLASDYYNSIKIVGQKFGFEIPRKEQNDYLFLNLLALRLQEDYRPVQRRRRAIKSGTKAAKTKKAV